MNFFKLLFPKKAKLIQELEQTLFELDYACSELCDFTCKTKESEDVIFEAEARAWSRKIIETP